MKTANIWALDFDGVICDSAGETAATGWHAAAQLWPELVSGPPPSSFVDDFRRLRPVLETGYQSILLARLWLDGHGVDEVLAEHTSLFAASQQQHGLSRETLIARFGTQRDTQLTDGLQDWLELHTFYPGVVGILSELVSAEAVYILTTKETRFVEALLDRVHICLPRERIFGLESGPKPAVLSELKTAAPTAIWHFVEDRLAALQAVDKTPDLGTVRLYLATWGYNTPADREVAVNGHIRLIDLDDFRALTAATRHLGD